jgi:hypothetical protein
VSGPDDPICRSMVNSITILVDFTYIGNPLCEGIPNDLEWSSLDKSVSVRKDPLLGCPTSSPVCVELQYYDFRVGSSFGPRMPIKGDERLGYCPDTYNYLVEGCYNFSEGKVVSTCH